jgi:hypothetical protein
VFNVAHMVLKAAYPDRPPYRIFEIPFAKKVDVAPSEGPAWSRRATDKKGS